MMTIVLYTSFVARTKETGRTNLVRPYRRRAEMTQAQLAESVCVSRQTVVSIEAGDYAPSVYLAIRLAAVFDTTVEALFDKEQNI